MFNQQRYNEVIRATMLEQDLSTLPHGDKTRTGSNGVALSGGQKQRLSMARALYLDSSLLIFDDVLRGLDADTEERVFHRDFGPCGLLQPRNATVVLCTHAVRHLPYADYIVALGEDGTIVEQGTWSDLFANKKYIHSLGIEETDNINSAMPVARKEIPIPDSELEAPTGTVPCLSSSVDEKDEKARMDGDSTAYGFYLASIGKKFITVFIVFGLGWGFFYNWGTIWLQYWSTDVSSSHPSRSNGFYIGLYGLFQLTYLMCLFSHFIICFRTMVEVSGAKLHKAALSTVFNAPLEFFTTADAGQTTNLFSQDMTLIDNELPIAVTNLALDICNATGMAAVIATASPFLVISYPFVFVILYLLQKFYLRTARQLRLLDLEAKSPLYTHFLDTVKGVVTLRALGWVPESITTNNRILDTSQRPSYLLTIAQRWLGFALQLLVAVLAVMVVTLATQLGSHAGLTGASLVTLMTFGDILNYIIRFFTQLETSIGAISRLKNFSERVTSENLPGQDMVPPAEWPSRGGIEISEVSALYSSNDSPDVLALERLTLSIKPGEKVAICGRTGSGKSSTILLLLRLLDPLPSCAENITIDGMPLHKIDRATLRKRIIAVPQDAMFLPDGTSVKANLDPTDTATDSECCAVLESVGLGPLVNQPRGVAAALSAGALSQGQKQLFNLARAIIRRRVNVSSSSSDGGILLLDELSSGVDHETDRAIQRIVQEFKLYTIIAVSHRLQTVMDYDTVVMMDQGAMVERGHPRMLVQQDGSRFKELWELENKARV